MAPSEASERLVLARILTPRALRSPLNALSAATSNAALKESTSDCNPSGFPITRFVTRLRHLAAISEFLRTLRHPLHRFCTSSYPVIIDAEFLHLYPPQFPKAQYSKQQQQQTQHHPAAASIPAFSELRYRAPDASLNGVGSSSSSSSRSRALPWRHVPPVIPPDSLSLWDDIRCVVLQLLVQGSLVWVPLVLVFIWRRHCTTRRRKLLFILSLLVLLFFPLRPKPAIRKWKGWRYLHRYHRTSVIVENAQAFPPTAPTIYAVFPHGIVPAAPAAMASGDFGNLLGHFRLTAASIVRWCLVYGQLVFLSDAIPADKNSMKRSLDQGANLLVSPGGIAEIYETNSIKEGLHLKDRQGVVRLAMQTGARVVPVYCFGNSQAYRLPWGVRFLQPFARLMRIALVTFYGRFGLPVAFRVPLLYAVGKPMQISQVDRPSDAEVASAHALFTSEVRRIFETYKKYYGWAGKQLEIH